MAVYKKTQKGMEEVLTRTPGIDVRLVSILILVDGVREDVEIRKLAQDANLPADGLDILVHGGYLEQKFKGSPVSARPGPLTDAPPKPPPRAAAFAQLDPALRHRGYNELYAYLVKETKDRLGLRGFVFQLRIERASTLEGLKALIEPINNAITARHGDDTGQNFKRQSALLLKVAFAEQKYLKSQSGG